MSANIVEDFLAFRDFGIRISRNGRWIDQKCTYDAVCFVADCIVEYIRDGGDQPFQSPTIWRSAYAMENVQAMYSKPDPTLRSTQDEYNKFFREPMKMLAAAGVLREDGVVHNAIQFSVADMDMLEYVALRERNACEFLCAYIEKTIDDSGLRPAFESFFEEQNSDSYDNVKETFERFCYECTPIKNKAETGRIFSKVMNPLAYKKKKKGTEKGRLSRAIITLRDISYNRPNWRDELLGKDKNVSRGDYVQDSNVQPTDAYKINRAKKNVRYYNDAFRNGKSEVLDEFGLGAKATNMHHIFPKGAYPDLAYLPENIIALTSAQHMQCAHPEGNTSAVDLAYQRKCLHAKAETIKTNLIENREQAALYSFESFMSMLDEGLETDYFGSLDENDFDSVIQGIDMHFPLKIAKGLCE